MSTGTLAWIETEAARYGFHKHTNLMMGTRKISWRIKCANCPAEFSAYWVANTSPDLMVKNMRIRQWSVGKGERPLCPKCAHPKADKHPKPTPDNVIDHYVPSPTAMKAAIIAACGKKVDKITAEQVGIAISHTIDSEVATGVALPVLDKARLKNGASMSELATEARTHGALFTQGQLTPPADLAPPKKRTRGPDKKPRKSPRRTIDYKTEFADRTFKPFPASPKPIVDEATEMNATMTNPTPKPKIAHAVFQQLDAVFDSEARLYKNGYTDQRVAQDCGTSEDVVAYLRKETFGDLAEDPRISSLREDLELARLEMLDVLKKMNGLYDALASRIEQIAMTTKSR